MLGQINFVNIIKDLLEKKEFATANELIKKASESDLKSREANGNNNILHILTEYKSASLLDAINKRCGEVGISKNELVKVFNSSLRTPLHMAVELNNIDAAKILVEKFDADPNVKDKYGITLLHYIAEKGHEETLRLFVEEFKADINVVNNLGENILQTASLYGNKEIVRILIEDYQADIAHLGSNNSSLLFAAALSDDLETINFLVEQGIAVDHQNKSGLTAREYTEIYRKKSMNACKELKDIESKIVRMKSLIGQAESKPKSSPKDKEDIELVSCKKIVFNVLNYYHTNKQYLAYGTLINTFNEVSKEKITSETVDKNKNLRQGLYAYVINNKHSCDSVWIEVLLESNRLTEEEKEKLPKKFVDTNKSISNYF